MATIVESLRPAPSLPTKHLPASQSCPTCGTSILVDMVDIEGATRRIRDLEAQMELLKEKATAAVDKCADYEDQIRILTQTKHRDRLLRSNTSGSLAPSRRVEEPARPSTAGGGTTTSRFSFLTGRRASPNNATPPPHPLQSRDADVPADIPIDITLFNELERERALRAEAEARANKVDSEIEELSVQLFSQANEMVAEERKARAKLEERVETLERRDREKMGRLERLEKAVNRVERVKALLKESERAGPGLPMGSEKALLSPPTRR